MSMRNEPVHPPSVDLFAYRDGELPPEKRATVEAHVMGCSLCRTLIDQVSSLEAELRQSPDRSPANYLERLHESVSTRIEADRATAGAAGVEHLAREEAAAGVGSRRDRARRGRLEGDGGDERLRDAPRLPWAAILSTASAAAMVVVVAVFIVKQGIYQRASTPRMPSRVSQAPVGQPAEEPGAKVALGTSGNVAGGPAGRQESAARAKQEGAARDAAKLDQAAKDELAKRGDLIAAQKAAKRSRSAGEEIALENKVEPAEPPAAAAPEASAAPRASEDKEKGQEGRVTVTPVREYDELLSQFGLPPVWNSSVSPGALGRAERALRDLYLAGGAGRDSARVSLYLAEAARLRYAPGDSTLYEEIERRYESAVMLAGPDQETRRVAEERLRSLER